MAAHRGGKSCATSKRRRALFRSMCAGVAALAALVASSAAAQEGRPEMVCGPRADVAKFLATKYQMQPAARGLDKKGGMIEIFASATGQFVLIVTSPKLVSCFITEGAGWQALAPVSAGDPA